MEEVLKQWMFVVAADPGGEFRNGGHGPTNSAQIAWVGAPWADCGDYDSSRRSTLVAGSNGHRHMLAANWGGGAGQILETETTGTSPHETKELCGVCRALYLY